MSNSVCNQNGLSGPCRHLYKEGPGQVISPDTAVGSGLLWFGQAMDTQEPALALRPASQGRDIWRWVLPYLHLTLVLGGIEQSDAADGTLVLLGNLLG